MKYYSLLILIILFSILNYSCTKEIEFNGNLLERKMVVNGICALDSVVSVELSSSKVIPGYKSEYMAITDAEVFLFVNGKQFEQLIYKHSEEIVAIYEGNIFFENDKKYRVEVLHNEYGRVSSSEIEIGKRIPIRNISTVIDSSFMNDSYDKPKYKCKLKFSDPEFEENFYRLDISYRVGLNYPKVDSVGNTIPYYQVSHYYSSDSKIESDDLVFAEKNTTENILFDETNLNYALFTDELFNGKEYELDFSLNASMIYKLDKVDTAKGDFYQVHFDLQSLSKDTYLYMKSSSLINDISTGLFTEPIQFYSNIENGLGIWGAYSSSIDTLMLGSPPTNINDFWVIKYVFQSF